MNILDDQRPIKERRNFLSESLILIGVVVVTTFVVGLIGVAFSMIAFEISFSEINSYASGQIQTKKAASFLKVNQSFSMIGMFLGAVVFLLTTRRNILKFIHLEGKITPLRLLSSIALVFTCLPLVSYLVQINAEIAKSLGYTSKNLMGLYELLGSSSGTLSFIFSVFVMAILPAIAEEFLFRGVIQKFLKQWTKKPHIAIAITSFIFAIIHGNPEQVLGIFILGMVLGYLMYFTSNLLFPILLHFTNNFLSLFAMNLPDTGKENIISADYDPNIIAALVALILTGLIFYYLYKSKETPLNE